MDATEILVRARFEGAVGDTQPDIASIVGAGMVTGLRMRRTRRLQQGIGAVAGVGVIAAAGLLSINGGLFDNAAPPAHRGTVTELVPSNPRAFAAAVIAEFPADWKTERVFGEAVSHARTIGDTFDVTRAGQPFTLRIAGHPQEALTLNCAGREKDTAQVHETCTMLDLPNGSRVRLDTETTNPGTAHARLMVTAIAKRSDSIILIQMNQSGFGSMPGQSVVWNRFATRIAADPAVGFQTYQHFIDIEGSVPHFNPYRPPPK